MLKEFWKFWKYFWKFKNSFSKKYFSYINWILKFCKENYFLLKEFLKFQKYFQKIQKIFFQIKILHDEKIFFVRIFFKVQEQVVSFPTRRTRASGSVWAPNGTEKKAVSPLSHWLSNHRLQILWQKPGASEKFSRLNIGFTFFWDRRLYEIGYFLFKNSHFCHVSANLRFRLDPTQWLVAKKCWNGDFFFKWHCPNTNYCFSVTQTFFGSQNFFSPKKKAH